MTVQAGDILFAAKEIFDGCDGDRDGAISQEEFTEIMEPLWCHLRPNSCHFNPNPCHINADSFHLSLIHALVILYKWIGV
jgi:hypothetical protein